ncbi:RIIa domain-containing protein 1 [Octopus sinensis]|uniref:RIIa domain-containing protein 1 n=1 Tax=Octopus sinensis TaxID=2607531 RepID=A0A6P7U9N5_9MOLL|nr:RIIa domain-containing protein 1 [Octopus sinensis]
MAAAKPKHDPPHGMEDYDLKTDEDLGALSDGDQEKLNQLKIHIRIENEKYLNEHPEVECMLAGFLSEILMKQPDNIHEFAAEHFTNPNLRRNIGEELQQRQAKMKENLLLKNF